MDGAVGSHLLRPLGARDYDEVVTVMPTGCQTSGVLASDC
jgi:hypothetical protein